VRVLSGEAANAKVIVFDFTRPGLEHTIYCTRGEHANHYDTDVITFSKEYSEIHIDVLKEEFEDTKGVIRIYISKKVRQCNGQRANDKQQSTK
jgi:hypothetical protein